MNNKGQYDAILYWILFLEVRHSRTMLIICQIVCIGCIESNNRCSSGTYLNWRSQYSLCMLTHAYLLHDPYSMWKYGNVSFMKQLFLHFTLCTLLSVTTLKSQHTNFSPFISPFQISIKNDRLAWRLHYYSLYNLLVICNIPLTNLLHFT